MISNFYPRSPCGERRIGLVFLWWGVRISIHALLAESDFGFVRGCLFCEISIHALLAESDREQFKYVVQCRISIHALLAESDLHRTVNIQRPTAFLSTLSLRRATIISQTVSEIIGHFYPRSPCGERPVVLNTHKRHIQHFYPRSPCGERR